MQDENTLPDPAKEPAGHRRHEPDGPALTDEGLAETWRQHRQELRLLSERSPREYIDFDSHQLANDSTPRAWEFGFRMEIGDLVHDLIGTLNRWRYSLAQLETWAAVLERHGDDARVMLLMEFVDPLAESALNTPYRVKQALIFAAYRALDFLHRSEPPLEEEMIGLVALRKRSAGRPTAEVLLAVLGQLDSKGFRKATQNFRNRHHHGFAPGIEMGVRSTVTRFAREGSVGYAFGISQPLTLRAFIPQHEGEHRRAVTAFECFWTLVREVEAELRKPPDI